MESQCSHGPENHQLPHVPAVEGWHVLCAHLCPDTRMDVLLRQAQTSANSGWRSVANWIRSRDGKSVLSLADTFPHLTRDKGNQEWTPIKPLPAHRVSVRDMNRHFERQNDRFGAFLLTRNFVLNYCMLGKVYLLLRQCISLHFVIGVSVKVATQAVSVTTSRSKKHSTLL